MPDEPQKTDPSLNRDELWGEPKASIQPHEPPISTSDDLSAEWSSSDNSGTAYPEVDSVDDATRDVDTQPNISTDQNESLPSLQPEVISSWDETDQAPQSFEASVPPLSDYQAETIDDSFSSVPLADGSATAPQGLDLQPGNTSQLGATGLNSQLGVLPLVGTIPVLPVSSGFSAQDSPTIASVAKKSRKPLVVGLVVAAVIALLGGSSVMAYNVWFQNPQKVVSDALFNAVTAKTSIYKGKIAIDDQGTKVVVDMTTKQSAATGSLDAKMTATMAKKDYTFNGSALVDGSNDLYFKVDNLSSIVTELKSQLGTLVLDPAFSSTIDKLVAKLDSKWVKVSSADLKDFNNDFASVKTCTDDTIKKFKDDKASIVELTDVYKKNSFITIDKSLGTKNGSLGYQVTTDSKIAKAFGDGLKTTKVYKAMHDCDPTFVIDESTFGTTSDTEKGTVDLWVSRWSHQITELTFSSKSGTGTVAGTVTPLYGQPVQVATPASSTTLKQINADIDALLQEVMTSSASSIGTSAVQTRSDVSSIQMYAENYASDNREAYPSLAQIMPLLPVDIQTKLGVVTKGAADPSAIGYMSCGGTQGADISYYDTNTESIQHETAGICL